MCIITCVLITRHVLRQSHEHKQTNACALTCARMHAYTKTNTHTHTYTREQLATRMKTLLIHSGSACICSRRYMDIAYHCGYIKKLRQAVQDMCLLACRASASSLHCAMSHKPRVYYMALHRSPLHPHEVHCVLCSLTSFWV